uniref:Uncharacterized protein n=1 Tax=Sphaerodactylus townsendi TaxID=933632 RepID=A0ACB8EWJ6_9SAUR
MESEAGDPGSPAPRPPRRGSPKLLVRWFVLGLLWGVLQTVESSPSYMGVCQGYPSDALREFPLARSAAPPRRECRPSSCTG